MNTAYDRASTRISDTPELEPYRDTILADWPEGDAHYEWAATCGLEELLDWARDAAGEPMVVRGPGRPAIGPLVNMHLPQSMIDALDEIAERDNVSRAEVVRRLVAAGLDLD